MKRVVITGVGVVSPIGIGKDEYWKNLLEGKLGTSELACIDTSSFKNHRGGEIKNLDPSSMLTKSEIEDMERGSIMAVMAAKMALEDSGISIDNANRHLAGVSMGTTMGEVQALEKIDRIRAKNSENSIPKKLFKSYEAISIPTNVSRALGCNGRTVMIPNACAAGNFAISYSYELIRNGAMEVMFSGGADPFSWVAFTGFNRLGAVSHDVLRPFDKDSSGMMVGEGAGVVVMESVDNALRRNAKIYAEVVGYGLSCDANHMTAPQPDGIKGAMMQALNMAQIGIDDIDAVIAHGTGTPTNDRAEITGLGKLFNSRRTELPVTSIKSMMGHTMGAASAIEAVTNALMVSNDVIPPTINFKNRHPDMNPKLRIVGNHYLSKKVNYGMNNALAFGGTNSSIVLKKFKGMQNEIP